MMISQIVGRNLMTVMNIAKNPLNQLVTLFLLLIQQNSTKTNAIAI